MEIKAEITTSKLGGSSLEVNDNYFSFCFFKIKMWTLGELPKVGGANEEEQAPIIILKLTTRT